MEKNTAKEVDKVMLKSGAASDLPQPVISNGIRQETGSHVSELEVDGAVGKISHMGTKAVCDVSHVEGSLEILQVEGNIELPNFKVNLEIPRVEGNIELPNFKVNLEIPRVEGSHEIHVEGNLKIPDIQGILEIPGVEGNLEIPHVEGNIEIPHIEGNLKIPCVERRLEISHVEGSLEIPRVEGNLEITCDKGSLEVPHIEENTEIPHIEGNIEVPCVERCLETSHVEGNLEIPNVKGRLEVPRVEGSLELPCVDGSFQIPLIKGNLEIPCFEGSLEIPQVEGSPEIPCVKGSLEMPRGEGSLQIPLIKGNLEIPCVEGSLEMSCVEGSLEIPRVEGSLQIPLIKGNIEIPRVEGSLVISRVEGSLVISHVEGNLVISHVGGSLEISRVGGSLEIPNAEGNLEIPHVEGSLGMSQGNWSVSQAVGDIEEVAKNESMQSLNGIEQTTTCCEKNIYTSVPLQTESLHSGENKSSDIVRTHEPPLQYRGNDFIPSLPPQNYSNSLGGVTSSQPMGYENQPLRVLCNNQPMGKQGYNQPIVNGYRTQPMDDGLLQITPRRQRDRSPVTSDGHGAREVLDHYRPPNNAKGFGSRGRDGDFADRYQGSGGRGDYKSDSDQWLMRAEMVEPRYTQPDEAVEPVPAVINLPRDIIEQVSSSILDYYRLHGQGNVELSVKMNLRHRLFRILKPMYPGCGLYAIGSSMTGFGNKESDLDICLMLRRAGELSRKEYMRILYEIQIALLNAHFTRNAEVIGAKVPILKFTEAISGIQCDLNINNSVGLRNTHLLKAYSQLDERVKPLIIFIKHWARSQQINDAFHGTLSSISLTLMIIHYLQCGTKPFVLPCLQKLYPACYSSNSLISRLNLWEKPPMHPSDNKQLIAELFFGFLVYFADFKFEDKIMSVRLGHCRPCPRFEHAAYDERYKYVNIEEPFTDSNTAHSVYQPEALERIRSAFIDSVERLSETRDLYSIIPPVRQLQQHSLTV